MNETVRLIKRYRRAAVKIRMRTLALTLFVLIVVAAYFVARHEGQDQDRRRGS